MNIPNQEAIKQTAEKRYLFSLRLSATIFFSIDFNSGSTQRGQMTANNINSAIFVNKN